MNGDHNTRPSEDNQVTSGSHGGHIKLDGVLFLTLTLWDPMTSHLVYVTSQVTCLFRSQDAT